MFFFFRNTLRSFSLDITRDFSAIFLGIPPGISPNNASELCPWHQENLQDFLGLRPGFLQDFYEKFLQEAKQEFHQEYFQEFLQDLHQKPQQEYLLEYL